PSFISTTKTWSAILLSSGSSVLMSLTVRRISPASSRFNSVRRMATQAEHIIINKQRRHEIDRVDLRKFVSRLAQDLEVETKPFSIVFISDSSMQDYNRTYRGYDKPTDVLSFRGDSGYLGDILISSETAYNQVRKAGKLSFQNN